MQKEIFFLLEFGTLNMLINRIHEKNVRQIPSTSQQKVQCREACGQIPDWGLINLIVSVTE